MRQASAIVPLIRLTLAATALAALAACGGGSGDSSSTTTDKSYKGTVTSYTSPQSFSVDGIPVDASGSNATAQGLSNGSRVEVKGQMVNGTIQATRVEYDDDSATDDSRSDPNELDGRVTSYTSPTSFSVDGIPVDASVAPISLTVGMHVEVHGTVTNGVMIASRVSVEGRSDGSSSGSDDSRDDGNCVPAGSAAGATSGKSGCEDDSGKDDDKGKDDGKDDDKEDDRSRGSR